MYLTKILHTSKSITATIALLLTALQCNGQATSTASVINDAKEMGRYLWVEPPKTANNTCQLQWGNCFRSYYYCVSGAFNQKSTLDFYIKSDLNGSFDPDYPFGTSGHFDDVTFLVQYRYNPNNQAWENLLDTTPITSEHSDSDYIDCSKCVDDCLDCGVCDPISQTQKLQVQVQGMDIIGVEYLAFPGNFGGFGVTVTACNAVGFNFEASAKIESELKSLDCTCSSWLKLDKETFVEESWTISEPKYGCNIFLDPDVNCYWIEGGGTSGNPINIVCSERCRPSTYNNISVVNYDTGKNNKVNYQLQLVPKPTITLSQTLAHVGQPNKITASLSSSAAFADLNWAFEGASHNCAIDKNTGEITISSTYDSDEPEETVTVVAFNANSNFGQNKTFSADDYYVSATLTIKPTTTIETAYPLAVNRTVLAQLHDPTVMANPVWSIKKIERAEHLAWNPSSGEIFCNQDPGTIKIVATEGDYSIESEEMTVFSSPGIALEGLGGSEVSYCFAGGYLFQANLVGAGGAAFKDLKWAGYDNGLGIIWGSWDDPFLEFTSGSGSGSFQLEAYDSDGYNVTSTFTERKSPTISFSQTPLPIGASETCVANGDFFGGKKWSVSATRNIGANPAVVNLSSSGVITSVSGACQVDVTVCDPSEPDYYVTQTLTIAGWPSGSQPKVNIQPNYIAMGNALDAAIVSIDQPGLMSDITWYFNDVVLGSQTTCSASFSGSDKSQLSVSSPPGSGYAGPVVIKAQDSVTKQYATAATLTIEQTVNIQFSPTLLVQDGVSTVRATMQTGASVIWSIVSGDASIDASGLITSKLGGKHPSDNIVVKAVEADGAWTTATLAVKPPPTILLQDGKGNGKSALMANGKSTMIALVSDAAVLPGVTWTIDRNDLAQIANFTDTQCTIVAKDGVGAVTVSAQGKSGLYSGKTITQSFKIFAVPTLSFDPPCLPEDNHSTASPKIVDTSDCSLYSHPTYSVTSKNPTCGSVNPGTGVVTAGSDTGTISIQATFSGGDSITGYVGIMNAPQIVFDVDFLQADGNAKCWANVVAGRVPNPQWSIDKPDLGCSIDQNGRITAGTGKGRIVVRLRDLKGQAEPCVATLKLISGCSTECANGNCIGGGGIANNNSVDVSISLGYAAFGATEVVLRMDEPEPSARIVTRAALSLYGGDSSDVKSFVDGNGNLTQVKSPEMLAIISDSVALASGMTISLYNNTQVVPPSGSGTQYGLVSAATPFCVWTIQNPTQGDYNHIVVTETRDDNSYINDYTYVTGDSDGDGWSLINAYVNGVGTRMERRLHKKLSSPYTKLETYTVCDPAAGNAVKYKEVRKFKQYTWGEELESLVVGTGPNAITTTWTYYTTPGDSSNYRHVCKMTLSTGSWETYKYDSRGRPTQITRQFLDGAAVTGVDVKNQVENIVYDATGTVTEKTTLTAGVETSHKYSRQYSDGSGMQVTKDVVCQTRGVASIDDPNNMVTTTVSFPAGDPNQYMPSSIVHRDGTLTLFSYSLGANNQRTTITKEGTPNLTKTDIIDGTKTTKVEDSAGNLVSEVQCDIINSSAPLSSKVGTQPDDFGRPTVYTYGDGSTEHVDYACCGVNSVTGRDGVITTYGYDAMKRRTLETTAGVTTQTLYNCFGKVASETRKTGSASRVLRSFDYDDAGRLIWSQDLIGPTTYAISSANGHKTVTTTFPNKSTKVETFYLDGRLMSVAGTAVYPINYSYGSDADGLYKQVTRVRGSSTKEWTKVSTDMAGRDYKVSYPDNSFSGSFYEAGTGRLVRQIDPDGVTTLYGYNSRGELWRKAIDTDRDGNISTEMDRVEEYSTSFSLLAPINTTMLVVKHKYAWNKPDSGSAVQVEVQSQSVALDGSYSSVTSFDQTTVSTVTFQPDSFKRVEKITMPDSTTKVSEYINGRLTTVTMADASTPPKQLAKTSYDYYQTDTDYGKLHSVTDARNGTTSYTYDSCDQIQTVTTPAPGNTPLNGQTAVQVTSYAYNELNADGRIETITLPDTKTIQKYYCLTGELKKNVTPYATPVEYSYEQGRQKTITTWKNYSKKTIENVTTFVYSDDRGFLKSKSCNGLNGESYTYWPSGKIHVLTKEGSPGSTIANQYDNNGDLHTVTCFDAITKQTSIISYTYNSRGQVKTVSDNTGLVTYGYYQSGLLNTETYSSPGILAGTVVTHGYDAHWRRNSLTVQVNGNNIYSQSYAYHASDSLLQNLTFEGNCVHYDYDDNATLVKGTILKVGTESGATILSGSLQHNFLNRLAVSSVGTGPGVLSSTIQYNSDNQVGTVTLQDNSYWNYLYDQNGQLLSANKFWGDTTPVAGQQFTYTFDDSGNRLTRSTGGDNNGQQLRTTTFNPLSTGHNQFLSRVSPGYANVIGTANPVAKVTVNSTSAIRKDGYFFAEVPITATSKAFLGNVTVRGVRWDYNALHDVMTEAPKSVAVPQPSYSFSYYPFGAFKFDGFYNYTWDAQDRMISAEIADYQKVVFDYDYLGRRVQKRVYSGIGNTTLASTRRFIYDGWNLLAEVDATGNLVRSYAWGLDDQGDFSAGGSTPPVLVKNVSGTAAGVYFVAGDVLGNVAGLFNAANGTQSAVYEYGPFGEVLRSSGVACDACPFRYSGKYFDSETRLVYFGYRYYNPDLGCWLNRDPLREGGGANLYGFVGNDPINHRDLLGLIAFDDSPSFMLQIMGRCTDPRAFYENISGGDSLRVGKAFASSAGNMVWGAITGLFHPVNTFNQMDSLAHKLTSGELMCLLGENYQVYLHSSPAEQEEMLGNLVGVLTGTWASGAGASRLSQLAKVSWDGGTVGSVGDVNAVDAAETGAEVAGSEASAWRVGPHGEMPSPRPAGFESHHGVNTVWMEENIPGYVADDAPAVLMKNDPFHNATRGLFNRFRSEIAARQGVSPRNIDWSKVSPGTAWRLAEEQFEAAQAPESVRAEYFRQLNEYLDSLPK